MRWTCCRAVSDSVFSRLARGARRIGAAVRRSRIAPVAALLGIVAVALIWRTGGSAPSYDGAPTVRIGVSDGDSVPEYVASARTELARLVAQAPGTPVYALVSFDGYLAPRQIADLTSGTGGGFATIAAYARAQLPGRQTELVRLPANRVPDDLVAGMTEVADRKTKEATADLDRAGADAASRSLYESMATVAIGEAVAYRATCACVYSLVVRAAPAALAVLAGRDGVRVVDAAPELTDASYGVFVAPLPEQVSTVGPLPESGVSP
jgi:hypothetical protein